MLNLPLPTSLTYIRPDKCSNVAVTAACCKVVRRASTWVQVVQRLQVRTSTERNAGHSTERQATASHSPPSASTDCPEAFALPLASDASDVSAVPDASDVSDVSLWKLLLRSWTQAAHRRNRY